MNATKTSDFDRYLKNILILAATWVACIMVFAIVLLPLSWGITAAEYLGSITWVCVVFFWGLADRLFRFVKAGESLIIGKTFERELATGELGDRPLKAQYAIESGISPINWDEYVVARVNMQKQSLNPEDETVTVPSSEGLNVVFKIAANWAVIPGLEVNYHRYRGDGEKGDANVAQYHASNILAFLQVYARKTTINNLLGDLKSLRTAIDEEFLKDPVLREFEKKAGSGLINILIRGVTATPETQKVISSEKLLKVARENAKELVKASGNTMSLDLALKHNYMANGTAGITMEHKDEDFDLKIDAPSTMTSFALNALGNQTKK